MGGMSSGSTPPKLDGNGNYTHEKPLGLVRTQWNNYKNNMMSPGLGDAIESIPTVKPMISIAGRAYDPLD